MYLHVHDRNQRYAVLYGEASTCMYRIDSCGVQHSFASTCIYNIDSNGLQHDKAITCMYIRSIAMVYSLTKQVPV